MSDTITPVPGKHYRTRDGSRARIYATDAESLYEVHGAIQNEDGWAQACWTKGGQFYPDNDESSTDLIAEWTEPMVPWSECPSWVKWQAMDEDGDTWGFEHKPELNGTLWHDDEHRDGHVLFPSRLVIYRPADYSQSLIERPNA